MAVGNGGNDVDAVNAAYAAGSNSIENNYLAPNEKKEVERLLKEQDECQGQRCDAIEKELAVYQELSDGRDKKFKGYLDACKSGHQESCSSAKAIHYDLRLKWTLEGNEYYKNHKGEFDLLSNTKSVYHVHKTDPETGKVIDGTVNNKKYIHHVYGYEVVLDANNNIITDPVNAGTYNFYNPSIFSDNLLDSGSKHTEYDVAPYEKFGNSSTDPTTEKQRGLPLSKLPSAIGADIHDDGKSTINAVKDFFSSDKTN